MGRVVLFRLRRRVSQLDVGGAAWIIELSAGNVGMDHRSVACAGKGRESYMYGTVLERRKGYESLDTDADSLCFREIGRCICMVRC